MKAALTMSVMSTGLAMTKGRAWRYGVQKMTATQRTALTIVTAAMALVTLGRFAMTFLSAANRLGVWAAIKVAPTTTRASVMVTVTEMIPAIDTVTTTARTHATHGGLAMTGWIAARRSTPASWGLAMTTHGAAICNLATPAA